MALQLALGCNVVGYASEHRTCDCCTGRACFNGGGFEWIEILGAVQGECPTWTCLSGRYYDKDSIEYNEPGVGFSPCFREWPQPPPADVECVVGQAAAALGGNVYLRRIFYCTLKIVSGARVVSVWVSDSLYDHPAGPPAAPHAFRVWLWRKTLSATESGVITLSGGLSSRAPADDFQHFLDSLCTYPNEIKIKICQIAECAPPSCKCWDETEGSYADAEKTAYLDVCGGTVIDGDPGYTGCSNGAYFAACGALAGPCWSLAATCGTPYNVSFGCTIAGITTPGGYVITFSYTASAVTYSLISYTNIDAGGTNLMLACQITGQATAATIEPIGCPGSFVPVCGLGAISATVDYFTFPSGNINSRTAKTHAEFLTLSADAYAPICDYTAATVDLELI